MNRRFRILLIILISFAVVPGSDAIEIVVDYTFDSQNFFDTQEKRDALQAAADRYSRVIDSSLLAVSPEDSSDSWRIGFAHPGTGDPVQISTAATLAADLINTAPPADVYGFPGLREDRWILYAGGRSLISAGFGGTGTGINFTTTFDDPNGPLHRGLISNTPDNSVNDLPVWGGAVTFDTGQSWHFDLASEAAFNELDFYSIALHEIGHALGLASHWNQWQDQTMGAQFVGGHALSAYNQDHGTTFTALNLESSADPHWQDNAYDSFIFPVGDPLLVGTVGAGELQDLLMEPVARFGPTVSRFELTNVDAASLVDVGWSVIPGPELDRNGDGRVDAADIDVACVAGGVLDPYFAGLGSLPGDLNLDGQVEFADFLTLSAHWGSAGTYSQGDVNCDGQIQFSDFLILSSNFGVSASRAHAVPEPAGTWLIFTAVPAWVWLRKRCAS